jgi:DNA repair protein RecO (recombination protein O)
MEWQEKAIVLGARKHGETSVIAEVLTRGHGRHAGIVRSGRSRRMRPVLQQGNIVEASWRARLEEHLGSFTIEPVELKAAVVMSDPMRLAGLTTLTSLCSLLPEREPHPMLYDGAELILSNIENRDIWPALLVRWEAGLLDSLGFGLDFSKCAATGQTSDLVYVSPKTGRAVGRAGGEPYKNKLFSLPAFLLGKGQAENSDLVDGFTLTGFFLNRHLFGPRGMEMPETRLRLIDYIKKR